METEFGDNPLQSWVTLETRIRLLVDRMFYCDQHCLPEIVDSFELLESGGKPEYPFQANISLCPLKISKNLISSDFIRGYRAFETD